MTHQIHYMSATELGRRIRRGNLSSQEVVGAALDRIRDRNDEIKAFITVIEDAAIDRAREADKRRARGEDDLGLLHGVPVGVKDLFGYKAGVRHTFGSRAFADFQADRTAIVVDRLEAEGAIVVGKTNTPEFGSQGTCDNELFGPTVTPFDINRTSGGSSGGSAAAVADGMVPIATGSDIGGSLRIPASACGVVGVKPSFGLIPHAFRPNAFAAHTPFLTLGPITRTVEDAALLLDLLSGPDPRDPFAQPAREGSFRDVDPAMADALSIAYSPDLGLFPVDSEVLRVVGRTVDNLRDRPIDVTPIELSFEYDRDELTQAGAVQLEVFFAAMAEGLERSTGIDIAGQQATQIGKTTRDLVEAGQTRSAIEYKRTEFVRTTVRDRFQQVFTEHDVLLTPTLAVPPFEATLDGPETIDGTAIDPWWDPYLTWPFNWGDFAVASVPAGFSGEGLPIGVQVVAPRFEESAVLAVSGRLEQIDPWVGAYPGS